MKLGLIVALDTSDRHQAMELAETLVPAVRLFKVGLELYTAHGPAIVRDLASVGAHIFLDLKLHDIPNTVAGAVSSTCALPGVSMITVHASGGEEMLNAAVMAANACEQANYQSEIHGARRPAVLGVTVLTSLDSNDLSQVGVQAGTDEQVQRLATLARNCGLDGVVCSPQEAAWCRETLGPDFVLVTPGIRPTGAGAQDQKRIATPAMAMNSGASFLVVGRPVTQAGSPLDAAQAILDTLPA